MAPTNGNGGPSAGIGNVFTAPKPGTGKTLMLVQPKREQEIHDSSDSTSEPVNVKPKVNSGYVVVGKCDKPPKSPSAVQEDEGQNQQLIRCAKKEMRRALQERKIKALRLCKWVSAAVVGGTSLAAGSVLIGMGLHYYVVCR